MRYRSRPVPDPILDGQESVWDYPRPAICRPNSRHLVVTLGGETIVDTRGGFQVLETSHPPTYYIPPEDISPQVLRAVPGNGSRCEWKGAATYFDVLMGYRILKRSAWTYRAPSSAFRELADHIALYAHNMDACFVDGERVIPQAGAFYGGWITSHVAGPFKGEPGTEFW